ncbi:rhomboid family intramembrane serine protease [uncultured Friedmanniella sp.]|uniref:rhomboid family intramembrane serine protease n=1 Tax=uncultured Friedmanniella sp. TaxID=335381 RepID=UPI0035CA484E
MQPASVGFQCPRCVGRGQTGGRLPKRSFGRTLTTGGGTATKVVMGVLVAVYVLDLISANLLQGLMVMSNFDVAGGQFWRLVTAAFTSGTILGLLMNLLVLWLAGRAIEAEMGGWRFLALYLAAGLGGSTLFFVLGPFSGAALAASAAVIGLLAANAIGKHKGGEDIRGDVGLLVLLVLYAILIGFDSFGWLTLVGGIVVGALVGAIMAYAPRRNRGTIQVVGLLGVVVLCGLAVVAKLQLF